MIFTHLTNTLATDKEVLIKVYEDLLETYTSSITTVVPKKNDLTFGNTVKKMKHAVIFYIDMRKSRKILENATDFWSIKIHKAFLRAVTHCIEKREGHLRSFNGDGILAFFIGENAASKAVRSAMEISGFVVEINDALVKAEKEEIDFGIGIAQGEVMVAKTGKGGDDQTKQDLIWIGLAVYLAVELSELGNSPNHIWISHNVRSAIEKQNHLYVVYNKKGESMWSKTEKILESVGKYDVRYTSHYYIP